MKKRKVIIIGLGLAALYWFFDSIVMVLIFSEGNFIDQLLMPQPHEMWMRSAGAGIIFILSIYTQLVVGRRNLVEEALRDSREKYQVIFDEARDGIVLIDGQTGHIVDCNPEYERQTGRKLEQLRKMKVWESHPAELMEEAKELFFEIRNGNLSGSRELNFQRPDGVIIPIEFESKAINIRGKQHLSSIVRDITERKQTEQELKKYRDHLEELVRGRTAELTAVNRQLQLEMKERKRADAKLQKLYKREQMLRGELEEQMKQRVEFTRALVHELKTPLTALLAAGDLLAADIKEQPHMTLVSNIQQGTLNLNRSIDELLDLSRGEIGMLRLRCSSVNIRQLLREVADFMTPEATKKQQSLVLELAPSLSIAWGDKGRLRQVLLNLLGNAFKFTPEGGRIILKARQEESALIVEVKDTGCGISREKQKRLFKPYYRQESDSEQYSGLGLGLALCKTLVELHGGKIWVTSHNGKGSAFTFAIPCERPGLKEE